MKNCLCNGDWLISRRAIEACGLGKFAGEERAYGVERLLLELIGDVGPEIAEGGIDGLLEGDRSGSGIGERAHAREEGVQGFPDIADDGRQRAARRDLRKHVVSSDGLADGRAENGADLLAGDDGAGKADFADGFASGVAVGVEGVPCSGDHRSLRAELDAALNKLATAMAYQQLGAKFVDARYCQRIRGCIIRNLIVEDVPVLDAIIVNTQTVGNVVVEFFNCKVICFPTENRSRFYHLTTSCERFVFEPRRTRSNVGGEDLFPGNLSTSTICRDYHAFAGDDLLNFLI